MACSFIISPIFKIISTTVIVRTTGRPKILPTVAWTLQDSIAVGAGSELAADANPPTVPKMPASLPATLATTFPPSAVFGPPQAAEICSGSDRVR
mmetsp:Transcript_147916/g.359040  ORF Transcript_147916/g.359040 Transcript_147916/m.359040 type:complete len:95 (+) Transcript_147916:320-604(+)